MALFPANPAIVTTLKLKLKKSTLKTKRKIKKKL